MQKNSTVKLMKHYATNGVEKARVWYSRQTLTTGRDCVTLYARDYSDKLMDIFGADEYQNESDIQTDYFEKGRVRIYPENPLWAEACARAERRA